MRRKRTRKSRKHSKKHKQGLSSSFLRRLLGHIPLPYPPPGSSLRHKSRKKTRSIKRKAATRGHRGYHTDQRHRRGKGRGRRRGRRTRRSRTVFFNY